MENMTKRRNKSKNYCCVPQCNSYYRDDLSFHKFPKDKQLRIKWSCVLKIGKPISNHMQVCSNHFRKEDYFFNRGITSKKHSLKRGSIPSCNLPKTSFDVKRNEVLAENRKQRMESRQQLRDHNRELEETIKGITLSKEESHESVHATNLEAAYTLLSFSRSDKNTTDKLIYDHNTEEKTKQKNFEDKGVQVNTLDDFINEDILSEIVTTDHRLRILTGIYNFALLNILIRWVSKLDVSKGKLSVKNKILLTMMRLKLDIPLAALSIFFNISASTAQATFQNTVKILGRLLKSTIRFPSKAEIQNNMPQCFEKYFQTRIVLDCTEIAVQKNKCLKCTINMYSYYKSRHTIKFLIGAAPSGLITYVSKAYGGRASDKAIFNKENLISKLDSGDAIMVDKGFLIEKECEDNNIKLIRPPFLRHKKQFTKTEAVETASIARARVHIERVIQRIKLFRICKNVIPFTMLPFVDNAMTIIVALTNLSMPILSKDKF